MDAKTLQRIADVAATDHAFAERRLQEERTSLEAAEKRLQDTKDAQDVVQRIAQSCQQQAHGRISAVVSRCLTAIFDDPYRFEIVFERKRGRTEARPVFFKGDKEVDPLNAAEGGAVDVASFALRVACLVLTRPPARRLLVLDEPMKNVNGRTFQERTAVMLETLARDLKLQMILATDDEWLRIGKVIEL